jgi:PAS domain S-box-containing protein
MLQTRDDRLPLTTILVVVDNATIRTAMTRSLSDNGFAVQEASNGAQAIRLAARKPGVIVLDPRLPDTDGFHVCRHIKTDPATANVPILMVSNVAVRSQDRIHGLNSGADGYLTTPLDPDELLAEVRALLRAHRVERETLREREAAENEWKRVFPILESSSDAFFTLDTVWRFTYANRALLTLAGTTKEKALGKSIWEVLPREMCSALRDEIDRAAIGVSSITFEAQYPSTGAWFEVHANSLPDAVWVHLNDVTGRKHAEDALRRNERLLRLVLDSLPIGVVVVDPAGDVLLSNPTAQRIWDGLPLGGVERHARSKGWWHNTGERIAPGEWASARALTRGDTSERELIDIETFDGTRKTIHNSAVPIREADGAIAGAVFINEDVTESLHLEEHYRQAQKMEAIGRLAGGIAHDFNNLLTIINGCAELLLTHVPAGDQSRQLLTEIIDASERSAGLTRQLLAFGRRQVLAPRVLDLNEVVANAEKILCRVIGEDIHLVTTLATGLEAVRADPGLVEQVLLNLAVNARDAMPTGGQLTIETRNVELDDGYTAAHPDARAGPHVLVAVSDTGSGMTPEVQARVFEPFFTTKEIGKGTGLGLATVHGIVKQSGGHIWLYSEVGRGTTFKVYLPRVESAHGATKPLSGVQPPPKGTETVLLAEDDDKVRQLARHVLENLGYKVLATAGTEEALRTAEGHSGPVDLLLTDVVMAGTGGRELAARMTATRPGLKVLFMSGYTDDAVVRHGILHESVNFLQKPFNPALLANKVREVLDQGRSSANGSA